MTKPQEHPKRSSPALTYLRRALVGQLWLRGYSERQIAEKVRAEASHSNSKYKGCENTTHVTVHYDVAANRKRWIEQMNVSLDKMRAEQVARLLGILHQAWADFEKIPRINPYARASYLRIALEAEEKLAKILGTLAPTKITGGEGEPLMPPVVEFHWPDGTVTKPPRNGDVLEEVEVIQREHGGNGSDPNISD